MRILTKYADSRKADDFATRLRRRRFTLFRSLVDALTPPLRILDVGGTPVFWEMMDFLDRPGLSLVLLNRSEALVSNPHVITVEGDARAMPQFGNDEFDIVFSNSVIEHVGAFEDQRSMAEEIRRIGKRYFVQTPNYYFPMEPHFLFPGFQFLPLSARACLLRHLALGWHERTPDPKEALELVSSTRLLTRRELLRLFPDATLFRERFLGMTKSFIVAYGWD